MSKIKRYDAVILGGGAAGLMCAITAGQRGKRVVVLEASNKLGKKILMSGGGRCNFTNKEIGSNNYICPNPHFVKSALKQYSNWDFISLVAKHDIEYHEKTLGQLFCDHSSKDIMNMLMTESDSVGVEFVLECDTQAVKEEGGFCVETNLGEFYTNNVVVATGGLSIPSLGGATGLGYQLAKQFGLAVSTLEASLAPFTLSGKWHELAKKLSGVSIPVYASVPSKGFSESMLFTHRGLSGPSILQLSNYWRVGEFIEINLLPQCDAKQLLLGAKISRPQSTVSAVLGGVWPKSLVQALEGDGWWSSMPLQTFKNTQLVELAESLHAWKIKPSGTEGYRTAEVTRGGVDVEQISSKTMQVENKEGLFFIGEVLDVTGQLGGFNFQWAWSSGYVAGLNV